MPPCDYATAHYEVKREPLADTQKLLDLLTQERYSPPGTDTEDFPWLLPLRERDSVSAVTKGATMGWSYICPTS